MLEYNASDATMERLGDVVGKLTRTLRAAGIETPGLDARRLIAAACGCRSQDLIARPEQPVPPDVLRRLDEQVRRRCAGEPVSRILGCRDFYGRVFSVSPATLDPRPDSETVIEMALQLAAENGRHKTPLRILDVGTGSGCLLVTLLAELPHATGLGTDIDAEALKVAAANAQRHGVAQRARFKKCDALRDVCEQFDLMVCNPPYIPSKTIKTLSPEVRVYDPAHALDGGADGLDAYRAILPDLARVVPGGWAIFEVGAGQAGTVSELLCEVIPETKCRGIRYRNDFGGHIRCVAMEIQL